MTDAETKRLLTEGFSATPVGHRVLVTGWVEEDTVWERTERGWKKVALRTSTDEP